MILHHNSKWLEECKNCISVGSSWSIWRCEDRRLSKSEKRLHTSNFEQLEFWRKKYLFPSISCIRYFGWWILRELSIWKHVYYWNRKLQWSWLSSESYSVYKGAPLLKVSKISDFFIYDFRTVWSMATVRLPYVANVHSTALLIFYRCTKLSL